MIRPDLQKLKAKWQAALRLGSYDITVAYVKNLANGAGQRVHGLMAPINDDAGKFVVYVQDPDTWIDDPEVPLSDHSIEKIVIHEFTHVRLHDVAGHNADPLLIKAEERAVWALADALQGATVEQRSAMVRAMTPTMAKKVSQAAMRRQMKGRSMDAKQVLAAIKEQDEAAALKILEDWLAEQIGGPGAASDPTPDGMGAEPGNGAVVDKDKPPMNMGDDKVYARAMAAVNQRFGSALAVVESGAKREIVRAMRADGLTLTPHAEKQIVDAKTLEEAQIVERAMRSMAPAPAPAPGAKLPAQPPADRNALAGLSAHQRAAYQRHMRSSPEKAARFLESCNKTNAGKPAGKGN